MFWSHNGYIFLLFVLNCNIRVGGVKHMKVDCNTPVEDCSAPKCRYHCPVNCPTTPPSATLTKDSKPCTHHGNYRGGKHGNYKSVDVMLSKGGSVSLRHHRSKYGISRSRRAPKSECKGDMILANDASICIITCALPDYECPPRKYKQRCACPWDKPILKDVDNGICVSRIRDCPPSNTYVLPKSGLMAFKFIKQPEDVVKERGDTIRMYCTVSGNTNYQYYWYKSPKLYLGSHSITKSSDSELMQTGSQYYDINSIKPSDAGFYHCIVRTGDSVRSNNGKDAKYSLVSNTGYLRVEYIDIPDRVEVTVKSTQEKALTTILPCELPESEPPVVPSWYKDNKIVSDVRMFVTPKDADEVGDRERVKRGYLYIMMADKTDAGTYTCRASYKGQTYDVARVRLEVKGFIGQPDSDPDLVVSMPGRAKVGGMASFFCAGVGNPVPAVSWTRENVDGQPIENTENMEVTDFKRKLVIKDIQPSMDRAFTCTISSPGNRKPKRSILYLAVLPSSYNVNFVSTPKSFTVTPNEYRPFTLQCAITVDPVVEGPVMYWLKNGASLDLKPSARIITATKLDTDNNGTTLRNITLTFKTPNESDQGVYQCIVENKGQMRQATAYVDVEKMDVYDIYFPQEYFISPEKKTREDAADFCSKKWKPKGHLVTISNKNESETVFRLLVDRNITRAWIGLSTSDNEWNSPGIWRWQVTNKLAKGFSYWYTDNPDNASGNETSAVVDITKAGRWFDVDAGLSYPFVCSRYTARCPSIAEFYNKSAEPILINGAEDENTFYDVGNVLSVTCVGNKNSGNIVKQDVTCLPSGKFDPPTLPCPVVARAMPSHVSYFCIVSTCFLVLLR